MKFRSLITGLVMCLPMAEVVQAQPYLAGSSEWRPFSYTDEQQQLHGVAVDIARQVLGRAGIEARFTSYPVNRLQVMLDKEQLDINYAESPTWKEPDQATRYVFSTPYLKVREHLYFVTGNPLANATVEQLQHLTIGMVRGYTYRKLDPLFEVRHLLKLETSQDLALLELLQIGRVDAVAMVDDLYEYLIATKQIDPARFSRGAQLSDAPLAIMLQKKHAALLPQINAAITALQNTGDIRRIQNAYMASRTLACASPDRFC